jgi:uncharacterized protein (DUF2147 family)
MAMAIQLDDMDVYATGSDLGKRRTLGPDIHHARRGAMTSARFGRPLCSFRWYLIVFVLFLGVTGLCAADDGMADMPAASGIVGDWLVESRDAVIHIERVGDEYQGYILWQLHDTYGPEDGPDLNGKIVTDRNNPDPSLRDQPLTGLRLLKGLRYDANNNKWIGGRVYNSENGKTYNCLVRLLNPNRLQLRGYIGISLLGGNTVWSRVTMKASGHDGVPYVMQATDK